MTIDRLKHDRVDVGDGFDLYNAQVKRMDENFIDGCNRTMDTLLVFAGLFSAVVTAFIIQIQQLLEKTPQDRTNELILIVIQQLNSSDFRPDISDHFTESGISLATNLLLFGSLVVTLFAALAAILVKQWILSYDHRARAGSSFQAKARARYRAWSELENAHLLGVISAIPMLLHSGLFLFFAGLVAWLFKFGNRSIFGLTIGLTGLATLFYLMAGVIGSFKHGSPFQWSGVDFLRKIVRRKVPMQDSPFLEDATDSPTRDSTILVADDLSNANGIKLLPFHQDDVAIVCTAMESSISSSDVAREIMQLRNLMLLPGFDPETAFDDRRDPKLHSSRDHRLMVLQRCTSLAASCVVETTGTPWLKPEAAQQARAVCHFLEAYLQFKFSGSDHYQILRAAKLEALAEALIDYSLTQPGGRPADVVVAVAVIAKLSHKVNGYKSRCRQCFQFEHLPESFLYGNNGIMKRDEEEVQQLAVGGVLGGSKAISMHRYLRIIIMVLTDCLLHHYRPARKLDWDVLVDCYQEPIKKALAELKNDSKELLMLRIYLDQEKERVTPGSREYEWIEAVYPMEYGNVNLDAESISASSKVQSNIAHKDRFAASTANDGHAIGLSRTGASSIKHVDGTDIV